MADDLYEVLGVEHGSSEAQIRAAYRDAARRSHPDGTGGRGRDHARFTSIVDAWAILGNQRARAEYDAAQQPGIPEQVVVVTAEPVTMLGRRFSQQIRRTFIAAIIVVTSLMLVLFVVGMSQSGGG